MRIFRIRLDFGIIAAEEGEGKDERQKNSVSCRYGDIAGSDDGDSLGACASDGGCHQKGQTLLYNELQAEGDERNAS